MEEQTKYEVVEAAPTTPMSLINIAVQQNADLDKLERLMALQERWEANEAKKAYVQAMAAFKSDPPKILKDKVADFTTAKGRTTYRYANLATVATAVGQSLSKHGLSASWKTEQNGKVTVTCTITHEAGHSESCSLSADADQSGGKNAIQAIGSTISYLQKYSLLALTGLAADDQDDDGAGAAPEETKEKFDQWVLSLNDVYEAGTAADVAGWWKDNGPKVKEDLPKAEAAKVYKLVCDYKKRLEILEAQKGGSGGN
jgi:hypothetical protein